MRLSPISRADLIKRLRAFDWVGPVSGKKHQRMNKGNQVLIIPNPHGGRDIGVPLLKEILNEAGISREEWVKRG
jgi:predicted RNA binding protein YcfA (HicA-like mRNA interferase family)